MGFVTPRSAKYVLAIILACVGLFAVGRLVAHRIPSGNAGTRVEAAIAPAVSEVLSGGFDTVPSKESVGSDVRRAREQAREVIAKASSPALPVNRREDLSVAFEERLSAVINPDYMRDLQARVARGQPVEAVNPGKEALEEARMRGEFFALLPMDIHEVEVRPVYERGVYVAESMTAKGFGELTTRLGREKAFPMNDLDPIKDKLDIVEVLLPMDIPIPTKEGQRHRSLVGFQFVWDVKGMKWIPWANKCYHNPETGAYGLPF